MQKLLGPVEYLEPPNAPAPIPVLASVTCKEGIREIPAGDWYTDGPSWKWMQIAKPSIFCGPQEF